jgi:two-component SAPR family response regulator
MSKGMSTEPESQSNFNSATILVVEDQFLFASALTNLLEKAGFIVVGPASRVAHALDIMNNLDGQLGAAILDVDVAGERSDLIAEELLRQGIPFMFTTTHNRQGIAARFADRPHFSKPYDKNILLRVLSSIIKQP